MRCPYLPYDYVFPLYSLEQTHWEQVANWYEENGDTKRAKTARKVVENLPQLRNLYGELRTEVPEKYNSTCDHFCRSSWNRLLFGVVLPYQWRLTTVPRDGKKLFNQPKEFFTPDICTAQELQPYQKLVWSWFRAVMNFSIKKGRIIGSRTSFTQQRSVTQFVVKSGRTDCYVYVEGDKPISVGEFIKWNDKEVTWRGGVVQRFIHASFGHRINQGFSMTKIIVQPITTQGHPTKPNLKVGKVGEHQVVTGDHYYENQLGFFIPAGAIVGEKLLKEMELWNEVTNKGRLGGKKGNVVKSRLMGDILSEGLFYGSQGASWKSEWTEGMDITKFLDVKF